MTTPPDMPTEPPPMGDPVIAAATKPFYKKTWFIVVAVIAMVVIVGSVASNSETTTKSIAEEEIPVLQMPDVAGGRLDVALSDLSALGVGEGDVEIVGGGSLGILDESNWTVCEQSPAANSELLPPFRLIVDQSCSTAPTVEAAVDATQEVTDESTVDTEIDTAAQPESPVVFRAQAQGDIDDMQRDVADLQRAINDNSVFRILSNTAELSFNLGQLGSPTPPQDVAEAWKEGLADLDSEISSLSDLVSGDGTTKQVRSQVRQIRTALNNMEKVLEGL